MAETNSRQMQNLRVVQLLPAMHIGGVECAVVELSRALAAAGVECVVFSRAGALCKQLVADGGKHVEFDCGGKNLLTFPARVRRLRALLADAAPHLVHVHSRVPAWLLAFARRRDFIVVSTFHGIYSVNRYSARMADADAVICPSNAVRAHILQHYPAAEKKLHLIRGVDQQYFDPTQVEESICAELRARLRLQDSTVFAIVGRLSALKGHALFLQAFARLQRNHTLAKPPLALIVGDDGGRRSARLQQEAARLGIGDAIRFAGVVRQMREVYACSDVIVSASTKPEAFGRTVAEALAMQRAVVAPAHGGALDIVNDGQNGVLFPPADAGALAAAMAAAATLPREGLRESVAEFSLPTMAAQTLALYQTLHTARQ